MCQNQIFISSPKKRVGQRKKKKKKTELILKFKSVKTIFSLTLRSDKKMSVLNNRFINGKLS